MKPRQLWTLIRRAVALYHPLMNKFIKFSLLIFLAMGAALFSAKHLINQLDLKIQQPPDGLVSIYTFFLFLPVSFLVFESWKLLISKIIRNCRSLSRMSAKHRMRSVFSILICTWLFKVFVFITYDVTVLEKNIIKDIAGWNFQKLSKADK